MEKDRERLAIYLYGFARLGIATELPELPGVDGEGRVTCRPHGKIAALVSEVPVAEFAGPDAEARLSDVDWLAPRALRHELVVEEIFWRSPIFPARFGTLFSSADRLRQTMSRHHDEILSFLDWTAGQEEWAVKGYLDRQKAVEAVTAEVLSAENAALTPGTRFLQRQRQLSQAGAKVGQRIEATRERLRPELQKVSTSVVERDTSMAAPDGQQETVLSFAILIPREQVSAAQSAVETVNAECEPRGLAVQCTGPLPPFSFTPALDTDTSDAARETVAPVSRDGT